MRDTYLSEHVEVRFAAVSEGEFLPMRRFAALFSVFLIIICIALPVRADSSAAGFDFRASVDPSGACRVTVSLNLHLETPQESLTFPVPANAYDISVNGTNPSTTRRGETLLLDLSRILGSVSGDFSVSVAYTLPDVVEETEDGQPLVQIPILCGFSLPIDSTTFAVVLPEGVFSKPTLTSTYYQTRIEETTALETLENQVQGHITSRILGSDWLTLSMQTEPDMFPQRKRLAWNLDWLDVSMLGFAILALIYWLAFLRCLPPRRIRRTTAPDGITAGDIGPALTATRPELSMLVLQWAQLGYILIQRDDGGRVLLHKRMEMGHERSQYEARIFRSLFGRRSLIDGTGPRFAVLARKVAAGKPGIHGLFRRGSGNPLVFRLLSVLVGLFGGISMGAALGDGTALKDLLSVLIGMFGILSAWIIQGGFKYLHLRKKYPLWISLILWAIWIILGHMALEPIVATCVSTVQVLTGLAAAYGGRRTDVGKQAIQEILGLRKHMKTVSKEELQRILTVNPEYFHSLAPYAVAMGVDQTFAKRFAGLRMPPCPYLSVGRENHLTALEWSQRLRAVIRAMDEHQTQLFLDRLLGR